MTTFLTPTWVIGSIDLTYEPFLVDRDSTVDIGEPEMVVETSGSPMADGDIERVVRHGNRDYVIEFYIEGPTLADIADSEALLRAEIMRPDLELTHNPGDGFSATSVYEVQTAKLTPGRRDDHESHFIRKYTLTLRCAPFARSVDLVTIEALATTETPTTVTVSDASSTTGWSTAAPAAVSSAGGYVYVGPFSTSAFESVHYLFFAGASNPATPYVVIEWQANRLLVTGMNQPSLVSSPAIENVLLEDGWRRTTFDTSALPSASTLAFSAILAGSNPDPEFRIRDVKRTNQPPGVTLRQRTQMVEVEGTERTPVSLHLYSDYDMADMQVGVLATWPTDGSGYSPDLRRWRVSGNASVLAEGDTISGFSEDMKPKSVTCEVPNSSLPLAGYSLVVRLRASTTNLVGIDWAIHTFFPSTTTSLEGSVTGTTPWKPKAASNYEMVELGLFTLPTIRGVGGKTRVSFRCLATNSDLVWDEAFLFRVGDDCALTIVDHPPDHMWADPPGLGESEPTVFEGYEPDRSDNRHPGSRLLSMGRHILHPDGTTLYGAGITNQPRVAASYYPRWHSNAAS